MTKISSIVSGLCGLFLFFTLLSPVEVHAKDPFYGEILYKDHCLKCHGVVGSGTDKGPPLVDKIYRPGHHADITFHLAVRNGVRSHHWPFGDMPPVEGLKKEDVDEVIAYIRRLQREAGIE